MTGEPLIALSPEQSPHFAWMSAPPLRKVIAALERAKTGSARFVGGCVRDSLFGEKPKDFDIATILTPNKTIEALKAAGLRAAPTGVAHGTVTAIVDHQGVEVTSLRADIATDGRRAAVAFTQDWALDAARRDFSINAIYLTPTGALYDPVGGMAAIEARTVQFIGDAETRIREDYLRILRFFRFTARFSDHFDETGLKACAHLAEGVETLSAERIGSEFMAILSLPRAAFALDAMKESGVLRHIWPADPSVKAVRRLKKLAPEAVAPVALAVLFGDEGEGVGARLRLSNAQKAICAAASRGAADLRPGLNAQEIRAALYRQGREQFKDAAAAAFAWGVIGDADFQRYLAAAEIWKPLRFPLSGRDIVAAGIEPGPLVSRLLTAVEAQWIAEDFPGPQRALEILDDAISASQD